MLKALSRRFVSVGTNLRKRIGTKPEDECLKHITYTRNVISAIFENSRRLRRPFRYSDQIGLPSLNFL